MDLFHPPRAQPDSDLISAVRYDSNTNLWTIRRYHDIRSILADPATFRPDNALTAVTRIPIDSLRILAEVDFSLPPTLANNGTPTHPIYRKLIAQFFTSQRLSEVIPFINDVIAKRLAELEIHSEVDLGAELAYDLPCLVLLELLGITEVDIDKLKSWSTASLELFWGRATGNKVAVLAARAAEFYAWIKFRITRTTSADQGFFGVLRSNNISISDAAAITYFLLIAGQETTTQLLCSTFYVLAGRPELWHRLSKGEPGLAQACIEEVLRCYPPVTTWRRITAAPVTVSGVDIPAGAQLLLMLADAGLDPEIFSEPARFCPGRTAGRAHLAFGYGKHYCLGAGLARLEAHLILDATARRFPALRLAAKRTPPMLDLLSFRAPLEVQVNTGRKIVSEVTAQY